MLSLSTSTIYSLCLDKAAIPVESPTEVIESVYVSRSVVKEVKTEAVAKGISEIGVLQFTDAANASMKPTDFENPETMKLPIKKCLVGDTDLSHMKLALDWTV